MRKTQTLLVVQDKFWLALQQGIHRQEPSLPCLFRQCLKRIERYRPFLCQVADSGSTQGGKVCSAAEHTADILGQRANIRTLAAAYAQTTCAQVFAQIEQHQFEDIDFARLALDDDPLACQFVKRLPIPLQGRVHRRNLDDAPAKIF